MTRVRAVALPNQSLLHRFAREGDFLDCYGVESNQTVRDAAETILNFPGWVRGLMSLRNVIVSPFGLSTDGPAETNKIGLFPIESESEQEIVAGFNDKHLDFRVSVYAEKGMVYLSTWVHPNNIGGRVYLGVVMPFHIVIVRDALRRLAGED